MPKPKLSGMVCCRKPSNMSNKPNLATELLRKTKLIKKKKYKPNGGALAGEKLYLSSPGTMAFTLRGERGYYNHEMEWCEI